MMLKVYKNNLKLFSRRELSKNVFDRLFDNSRKYMVTEHKITEHILGVGG